GVVAGGRTLINSPFALHLFITTLSHFGLLITASIMGQAIHQDVEARATPLFYTLPITRAQYLGGRFLGAFAALVVVYAGVGLGCFAGTLMPSVDRSLLGPNRLAAYVVPYLVGVLPNLIFTGALFFAMAALTRNMRAVYVAAVVLLVGYLIAQSLVGDVEN